jgi:hypothetical protein
MIHPSRRRARRVLAAALLAAGFASSSAWADAPCTPVGDVLSMKRAPGTYSSLVRVQNKCYADGEHWQEDDGSGNVTYYQALEYYRNKDWPAGQKVPLIIWAHPTGPTQVIVKDACALDGSCVYANRVLLPAIKSGYALMSIQFRHPRASQVQGGIDLNVPKTDIANAVQWARQNADKLGIDPENIFLLGQSRGTLALLSAFMKDQRVDNAAGWRGQSSSVRAVFGVQAQTTYEHDELRDLFVMETTDRVPGHPTFNYHTYLDKADPPFVNPGSALAELQLEDPPFWLRYERWPTKGVSDSITLLGSRVAPLGKDPMKGECYEPNNPAYPELEKSGCVDVHHPNFGMALMNRYKSLNPTPQQLAKVGVQYGIASGDNAALDKVSQHFFDNYTCFFIQNTTPAGEVLREQATPPGEVVKCNITDKRWPPGP